MRVVVVVVAVLSLAALAQAAEAADLQAGWYAEIYTVWAYAYSPSGPPDIVGAADLAIPVGGYGPFTVTSAAPNDDTIRFVSVLTAVSGVGSDRSLSLPLRWPVSSDRSVDYVRFGWRTNYDPSQMFLRLWWKPYGETGERAVWSQMLDGARSNPEQYISLDPARLGSFRFELVVVPEPSGLLVLLTATGCFVAALGRRAS